MRKQFLTMLLVLMTSSIMAGSVYAEPIPVEASAPQENAETAESNETSAETAAARETLAVSTEMTERESAPTLSENEKVESYAEYLRNEETANWTLTPSEEAAGYEVYYGHKYKAGEMRSDDTGGDVIYGGIWPNEKSGYITVCGILPDYIHETAYVHVFNLNTYEVYGVMLYEGNHYSAQICVPSGVYMVIEGGLVEDKYGRFYAPHTQFNVRTASTQIVSVQIIDSEPEEADLAYMIPPETAAPESAASTGTASASGRQEAAETASAEQNVPGGPAEALHQQEDPQTPAPQKKRNLPLAIISTLVTVIPLGILAYIYIKNGGFKQGGGFYD